MKRILDALYGKKIFSTADQCWLIQNRISAFNVAEGKPAAARHIVYSR